MKILLSFTSAILLACLALSSHAQAKDNPSSIEAELTAFNEQYNRIAATYDTKAFLALYNDDALWIAPSETPVEGLDMPRNTFQFLVDNEGVLTHTIEHLLISDDGKQAVMIGQSNIKVAKADLDASGTYLFVLKNQKGEWKIVADMFNQHTAE